MSSLLLNKSSSFTYTILCRNLFVGEIYNEAISFSFLYIIWCFIGLSKRCIFPPISVFNLSLFIFTSQYLTFVSIYLYPPVFNICLYLSLPPSFLLTQCLICKWMQKYHYILIFCRRSRNCLPFTNIWVHPGFSGGVRVAHSFSLCVCVVLLWVFTFLNQCCDVRYDFRIKTMFGSSLPPVVCR